MKVVCLIALFVEAFASSEASVMKRSPNGMECMACMYVVGKLDSLVTGKETEEEIVEVLNTVCQKLPSVVAPECSYMVQTYGSKVVDLLLKQLSADVICPELGMC